MQIEIYERIDELQLLETVELPFCPQIGSELEFNIRGDIAMPYQVESVRHCFELHYVEDGLSYETRHVVTKCVVVVKR